MTTVRIYQPSQSTMQSGKGRTKSWTLHFEPTTPMFPDPLMGWSSSQDMSQEMTLVFPTLERAIEFAKARRFSYVIATPPKKEPSAKSYGTNFSGPPRGY